MGKLFRHNDKVSTPGQLQDYIRVTNPAVWLILAAVVVLLTGFVIAAIFAKIETTVDVITEVSNGVATFELKKTDTNASKLKEGMVVRFPTQNVSSKISTLDYYDEGVIATVLVNVPNGKCAAVVVIDVVSPVSFIIN